MQATATKRADADTPRFLHRKFEAPVLSEGVVIDEDVSSALDDLDAWQLCLLSARQAVVRARLWQHGTAFSRHAPTPRRFGCASMSMMAIPLGS